MPVMPCCCECCTCEKALPFLATNYTADVSGTWDLDNCPNSPGGPSSTLLDCPQLSPEDCSFERDALINELWVGGYEVVGYALQLQPIEGNLECFEWLFLIGFDEPTGNGDGPQIVYRQRSRNCTDPTGIYDLIIANCSSGDLTDPNTVPATITILDAP